MSGSLPAPSSRKKEAIYLHARLLSGRQGVRYKKSCHSPSYEWGSAVRPAARMRAASISPSEAEVSRLPHTMSAGGKPV